MAFYVDDFIRNIIAEQSINSARALNAWYRADVRQSFVIQLCGFAVLTCRGIEVEKQQLLRLIAEVDVLHPQKAAHHQPCSRDQHHGESQLKRHQDTAEATPGNIAGHRYGRRPLTCREDHGGR